MAKKSGFYFDVNDWQYSVDENGQMFVIPPDNEKKDYPEFLYKYYSLSERNIEAPARANLQPSLRAQRC